MTTSPQGIADADAADGHRTYGTEFCAGLAFAARLLKRTARDLTEGEPE